MSSRSHTDLQGHSSQLNKVDEFCAAHAKSDTDLFTEGRECDSDSVDNFGIGVDRMSSEIDNILQGISFGYVMPSPMNVVAESNMRELSSDKEHCKNCITVMIFCDMTVGMHACGM